MVHLQKFKDSCQFNACIGNTVNSLIALLPTVISWCWSKELLKRNSALHVLHLKGFSPVWTTTRRWSFRTCFVANVLLHWWHFEASLILKCECVLWFFSPFKLEKLLSHRLQSKGCFLLSLWTNFSWWKRRKVELNAISHKRQGIWTSGMRLT